MKKVLFLITTLNSGGAEKVLVDTVNALPSDSFSITVQTIYNEGFYRDKLDPSITYKTIVNHKDKFLDRIKLKFIYKVMSPKYVYQKYVKDDYDIEIAFLEGMPTRIIANSSNPHSKKIAWVHTDVVEYFGCNKDYSSITEQEECYSRFNKIVCVSESVRDRFCKKFSSVTDKTYTIYNLILGDRIKNLAEDLIENVHHDYPILMGCGRLCEQKGFDRLLHIHKRLIDSGINNYLWIVGDGALKGRFETYIDENNLNKSVTLWGFQSNPYKYIRQADLFVCSSLLLHLVNTVSFLYAVNHLKIFLILLRYFREARSQFFFNLLTYVT